MFFRRSLSPEEAKILVLGRLELSLSRPDLSAIRSSYWKNAWNEERLQSLQRQAEYGEHIRSVLVELYGADASRDLVFQGAFNPVPQLAFLSWHKQHAAEMQSIATQLRLATEQSPPDALSPSEIATSLQREQERPLDAYLSDFLDEEDVVEVLLRYSPLADSIRAADVASSEEEFRLIFSELRSLEAPSATPEGYLKVRESLGRRLGPERFLRLWASRDPTFAAIKRSLKPFNFMDATIMSAYEIVNDTQELLAAALMRTEIDPVRAQADCTSLVFARHPGLRDNV